jgi:putative ABC transport system permease protein
MALGRFLVDEDTHKVENVAVLGSNTARRLFPFDNPLDQTVRLRSYIYRVVGVVKERMPTGGSGGSQAAEDYNQDVYIPLSTCRARYGETITTRQSGAMVREQTELSQVTLTVSDIDKVRPTGDVVRAILETHPKNDWLVTVPLDKLEAAEREKSRFTRLLVIIGGISLLVGGIGIMNIMLATVTAGDRHGADARDWHPPRSRRQAPRHHPPVLDRGGGADEHRRLLGGRARP